MALKKLIPCIIILNFLQPLTAQNTVVELQNGTNGYNGCTDSYVYSLEPVQNTNYGNDTKVFIKNCPT